MLLPNQYGKDNSIKTLSVQAFNQLCETHRPQTIRFSRQVYPKVIDLGDTIIKCFYPKRKKFSSDQWKPYALRFCRNIARLRAAGFNAPTILKVEHCKALNVYLVYYEKMNGLDLRYLTQNGHLSLLTPFAQFLAELHAKKIIFGSIHLENILYQDGQFGLIDTGDVRFKQTHLLMPLFRYRNLKRIFREPNDKAIWEAYGVSQFIQRYIEFAGISPHNICYQWTKTIT